MGTPPPSRECLSRRSLHLTCRLVAKADATPEGLAVFAVIRAGGTSDLRAAYRSDTTQGSFRNTRAGACGRAGSATLLERASGPAGAGPFSHRHAVWRVT